MRYSEDGWLFQSGGMCNKIVGKGGWQSNRTENVLFKEKKLSG